MHFRKTGILFETGSQQASFRVWAPHRDSVEILLERSGKRIPLTQEADGYWVAQGETQITHGTDYSLLLDGELKRPDPASHYQPGSVHEPSRAVNHHLFEWSEEGWKGPPDRRDLIFYEIHPGAFSERGDFQGIVDYLDELLDLGITALELMPVSAFPGERNWGYDGVQPFAVQNSYGGPDGLKHLVNEAHRKGLSVFLDVVYNHMGPEGNYLRDFGPYFTHRYNTPWGDALNFDDAYSTQVRNYFFQNALHWFEYYHIDGLRLDAVHAIYDNSAVHFLKELAMHTAQFSRKAQKDHYLIAESDLNDSRLIRPFSENGYGLDGQWSDDFHHAVHTLLTGEKDGYYEDFGSVEHLTRAIEKGYVYQGEYSQHRKRNHGNASFDLPSDQFVICVQNHDQVGNRMMGERLSTLLDQRDRKLGAGILLLSPGVPLLFMGEEYGEINPFQYFVSHTDPDLVEAVRNGRREEFKSFAWKGEAPDPQAPETFLRSRLDRSIKEIPQHSILYELYRDLIHLRKEEPLITDPGRTQLVSSVLDPSGVFSIERHDPHIGLLFIALFNFSDHDFSPEHKTPKGPFEFLIGSEEKKYGGQSELQKNQSIDHFERLQHRSFMVYRRKTL